MLQVHLDLPFPKFDRKVARPERVDWTGQLVWLLGAVNAKSGKLAGNDEISRSLLLISPAVSDKGHRIAEIIGLATICM
jgi:hypothetical protein